MSRKTLSPEALALIYLRSQRGWLQKDLAARMGLPDYRQVSRHESGDTLSRETLDSYAACLGFSPEAVDALLFIHSMVSPDDPDGAASPVALTPEERRRIDRTALTAGWTTAAEVRETAGRRKRREKAASARREAEAAWERLKKCTRQERLDLVSVWPEFRSWALALTVCEASVQAAARGPEQALELADLALVIAERVEGEGWRRRLMGYAWAHIANAHRVGNRLTEANRAFTQAWALWRSERPSDPELLPEWRLLDLEASLRREERRFPQALELLDRALAASQGNITAAGRILLKKGFVLEQMGDIEGALAALREATPHVEASADPHLLYSLRFETAKDLAHLEHYAAAAALLPGVRELAEQQADRLKLLRVTWLEARVAAGQGRREEALAGLDHVRRQFTGLNLPYDAALASLELAVLWLEAGRMAEVRELALAVEKVFKAHGIDREALAALSLFCEAATHETATVELARQAMAEIEKAKSLAPRRMTGRRGRR